MILVTDASQRVALEITRCLGMERKEIFTVERKDVSFPPVAGYSRYCKKFHYIDSYSSDDFLELCADAECIIPVSTNTIFKVFCQLDSRISSDKVLLPDITLFKKLNSKFELFKFAKKIGVPCPETYLLRFDEFAPLSLFKLEFPVVLKLVDDQGLYLNPKDRYVIAHSEADYKKGFELLAEHKKDILLQEYIEGEAFGWSGLCDKDGKCVINIAHMRIREYPLSGGPSTCCESVDIPELNTVAEKIIKGINWRGPLMLEFKRERKTGEFKIIEINPRYWGSLPLARIAGLNIPLYHYNIIKNGKNGSQKNSVTDLHFYDRRTRKNNSIVFASGRDIKERGDNSADSRLCRLHSLPPCKSITPKLRSRMNPGVKAKAGIKMNFLPLEMKALLAILRSQKSFSEKLSSGFDIMKDCFFPFVKDGLWLYSDPVPVIRAVLGVKR